MGEALLFDELRPALKPIVTRTITKLIGSMSYRKESVKDWTDDITNTVMENIKTLSTNFKFVVSCFIMEFRGTGVHSATSCYWDNRFDGVECVTYYGKNI